MPNYTKVGPFVDNGAPGIDHNFLNGIETQLAAAPYSVFFLATPYLLLSAVTINSGVTNTYGATGGATGVPSGATGILFNIYATGATAGGWIGIKPHGATVTNNSNYPMLGLVQTAGASPAAFGMVKCDGSGQIDVTSNSSNFTGINMSIYGYIY